MKKLLCLLLVLSTLLSIAACGTTPEVPETPGDPVVETPTEPETPVEPEPVYEAMEIVLKDHPDKVKTIGRTLLRDDGLYCDLPGSGIEFIVNCQGDVTLTYNCATTRGLCRAFVDGEESKRPSFLKGTGTMVIAENLAPGEHTIRVLWELDILKTGHAWSIQSIGCTAVADSFRATEDKDLLIEFVGDSITSGYGVLSDRDYNVPYDSVHSATHSYAYLTAQLLDADCSQVSRGAMGLYRPVEGKVGMDLYLSYNCYDPSAPDYDFARPADIVVLAWGTNDSSCPSSQEYRRLLTEMVNTVREKNGEDVQIVIIWGMMSLKWGAEMKLTADELGCHSIQLSRNNAGGERHPDAAGMALNAQELSKFLREEVIPLVKK